MDITHKSVSLVGYGISNQAMCKYLLEQGAHPIIRNQAVMAVPSGAELITEDYLLTDEDIVFRSPVIRPDKIKGNGKVTTEVAYALEAIKGHKIAVTGSDGKTTTSTLIHKMLLQDGKMANLCGNIGTPAIEGVSASNGNTYTVCELSSFQLFDMTPTLDTAIVTNINENHLDWHRDMEEYIASKQNIIKNASHLVLNYDDNRVRSFKTDKKRVTYFTRHLPPRNQVRSARFIYVKDGAIYCDEERIIALDQIRLRAEFNVSNVQAAIGALYGVVSNASILEVARTFSGVESRMKLIKRLRGVSFIDSSIDSTPSRTIATLGAFEKSKSIVLLGGYDKNLDYTPLASALAGVKHAFICGQNEKKIYDAISKVCRSRIVDSLDVAVAEAYREAQDGDFIILSPASASFDRFENYKQRAKKFEEIIRGLK